MERTRVPHVPLVWRVRLAARLLSGAASVTLLAEGVVLRESWGTVDAVVELVLLVLFCATFVALVFRGFDDLAFAPTRARLVLTVLLLLEGGALLLSTETLGTRAVPFFVVAAAAATWGRRGLAAVTALVVVVEALRLVLSGAAAVQALALCAALVAFAVAMRALVALIGLCRELDEARSGAAQTAVAAERLRFARDLHDLLGHRLTLMAVKLRVLDRDLAADAPGTREEVSELSSLVASALHELRAAVRGYRSSDLGETVRGLQEALRDGGIEPRVDLAASPGSTSSAALEMVLKEAVTNVLRHSGATRCSVALTSCVDGVRLSVRDDGRADPSAPPYAGNGLRGASERVSALGGSLSHGPVPPHGYLVCAEVPDEGRLGRERDIVPVVEEVP